MHWKSLAKTALLGTERSALPKEVLQFLMEQGLDTQKDPSEVILEAAALFSQMNKAGFPLKKLEGKMPPSVGDDDEQPCTARSSHHLKLILDGTFEEALPEFIFHLNFNNKQLPPSSLPDLLKQCKTDKNLWDKIHPAIGKRGYWLMTQNPEWKSLIALPNEEVWKSGNKEERITLLKYFRKESPEKSIELLEGVWEKESYQNRVDFLKIFKINLSKNDESFLENCLYDSRNEVRKIAANLLAQIPHSELVERMYWRIEMSMKFENKKLEIELPDEIDETALRDGINPKMASYRSGLKAGYFGQMLSKVPPRRLELFFDKSPIEILQIFAHSDWTALLIQAVIESTILNKNEHWMEAILGLWLQNEDYPIWQNSSAKELLGMIPNKLFNQFTLKSLEQTKGLPEENSPAAQLLRLGKHEWDDQLTLIVIKRFQYWLSDTTTFYWDSSYYKKILQTAAYKANPTLYDALKSGWNYHAPTYGQWQPDIELFLRTLVFRKEMIAELEK